MKSPFVIFPNTFRELRPDCFRLWNIYLGLALQILFEIGVAILWPGPTTKRKNESTELLYCVQVNEADMGTT